MADPTAEASATPAPDATSGAEQDVNSNERATRTDEIGDAGRRAIAELRKELKTTKAERDSLKTAAEAAADAERSELEKASARAEAAEARVQALEHETLARQAAADAGIPEHWQRLHGSNVDELTTDAQAFAESIGKTNVQPTSADLGAGARTQSKPATGSAGFSERIRAQRRR